MAMKNHLFLYLNEPPSLQFIYKNTGNPELSVRGLLELIFPLGKTVFKDGYFCKEKKVKENYILLDS